RRILDGNFTTGAGQLKQIEMIERYIERIVSDVRLARPLKVVIDCGNGAAGAVAPELYRRLGCEATELFCEVDGNFPNHHPDPSRPENLQDLIQAVWEQEAEFGMAFDGDGDRLGVVGPPGGAGDAIIWPDRQLTLFARDVLSRQPGAEIIYDVKCSQIVPRAIEEAGGRATMGKTGHSFMKAALQESGAALAGEMSGHVFFQERWYGFDDGLYAGARLCELLSRDERAPGEVFAAIPDTVNTPELHLHTEEGAHHALVAELVKKAHFDDGRVSTIDGIRVDFENGFGLVRASNTTPTVIMRFEAENEPALAAIQERFRVLIHSVRPELELELLF
ncbi:MAG: phosphomannomutase/phosphoglucomutase, partial [Pseudomonadota bacterium]|nr:phosphomannomutase/phosphoglucomutase [Pseudomonadota bacterium]